jgi:hypothetical protein
MAISLFAETQRSTRSQEWYIHVNSCYDSKSGFIKLLRTGWIKIARDLGKFITVWVNDNLMYWNWFTEMCNITMVAMQILQEWNFYP